MSTPILLTKKILEQKFSGFFFTQREISDGNGLIRVMFISLVRANCHYKSWRLKIAEVIGGHFNTFLLPIVQT